jgi:hypothetical protein
VNRILLPVFLWALAAAAGSLPLHVIAPTAIHISLQRADTQAPAIERDLEPGNSSIELSDGTWRLNATGNGVWHKPQYVTIPARDVVEVQMWPAATVTGEIALPAETASNDPVIIRFEAESGLSGNETCAIVAKHFSCGIPAGTADFALRVPGHVTHYVWGVALAAGATRDLGKLKFVRGATLAGRIEPPRGLKLDLSNTIVTATPSQARTAVPLSTLSSHANAKGFFHIDGIAPGTYSIVAKIEHPSLSSPPLDVAIVEGAEAALSKPLMMSAQHPLTITVDPPADPWGKQWRVEIMGGPTPGQFDTVAREQVPAKGSYRSPSLHSGHYEIRIGAQDNGVWHREEIDVDDNVTTLFVPLHLTRVQGRLRLGDKPVAAKIWFGGVFGIPRVQFQSDEQGEFSGFVPPREDDTWTVAIQSESPQIRRNLSGVKLRRHDDGDLEADLHLDLTMLQGDLVEEDGTPVAGAMVNITALDGSSGEFVQAFGTEDGRFVVYGLPPGKYQATGTHFMQESRPTTVEVRAGEEAPPLRLVLLPNRELKGIIRSAVGPVPGANVTSWPTDVSADRLMTAHTDEAGHFAEIIAPGAEQLDVVVDAPGFAVKFFHAHWEKERQLLIPVRQDGGTLTINGVAAADAVIQHAGATLPLIALQWRGRAVTNGLRTTIEMIDAGSYTICSVDDRTACVSGFLPPFGTLELRIPERTNSAAK